MYNKYFSSNINNAKKLINYEIYIAVIIMLIILIICLNFEFQNRYRYLYNCENDDR